MPWLAAVVVKDHAGTAHQAIEGAVHKLRRAVGAAIDRHHPRHRRGEPDDSAADVRFDIPS